VYFGVVAAAPAGRKGKMFKAAISYKRRMLQASFRVGIHVAPTSCSAGYKIQGAINQGQHTSISAGSRCGHKPTGPTRVPCYKNRLKQPFLNAYHSSDAFDIPHEVWKCFSSSGIAAVSNKGWIGAF
jgi:hypothetical protein